MKELTIEQKAQRYDEAIKKAQAKIEEAKVFDYDDEQTAHTIRLTTTDIFPELKESEDESIRKGLIEYFLHRPDYEITYYGLKSDSVIAWLEKQGEQKPADIDNKFLRMRETKPANIAEFLDRLTTVEQEFLWEHIEKVKKLDREQKPAEWTSRDDDMLNSITYTLDCIDIKTNTEGEHEDHSEEGAWLLELKDRVQPQPQEWSEEDKEFLELTLSNLAELKDRYGEGYGKVGKCIDWLKSLQPQPIDVEAAIAYQDGYQKALVEFSQKHQEWTDDDINMIDWLIRCCEKEHEELCNDKYGHQDIVSDLKRDCRKKLDWLESLKDKAVPQEQWNPSKEQMDSLHGAANHSWFNNNVLQDLYTDSKKLTE